MGDPRPEGREGLKQEISAVRQRIEAMLSTYTVSLIEQQSPRLPEWNIFQNRFNNMRMEVVPSADVLEKYNALETEMASFMTEMETGE